MPTQVEYALMSANVYGNYPDAGGSNPVRSARNNLPVPTGWTQVESYKQNTPNTGFMASVYTKGSEVVISYCGTTPENANDWLMGNLPAGAGLPDSNNLSGPVVATQVVQAAKLYLQVLNDPAMAGKTITFTGHSLGGGLASLMAVYFAKSATVFDEAFFSKSADSAAVVNSLRTAITAAGYAIPASLAEGNYIMDTSAASYLSNSWAPSATRLERQALVTNISIKGEVLSVLSDGALGSVGIAAAIPLILASGFLGPLSAVAGVAALSAGAGIGKINDGASTPFDLQAKSNLGWGWGLEGMGVAGNAVDLHSVSLLTGLVLSTNFKDTLTQHPELLARLFASPYYKNDPSNARVDNLIEVLVKGQYQDKNTLNVLAADVNQIKLGAGLTAQDFLRGVADAYGAAGSRIVNVAAALVDAELAGLYNQRLVGGVTQSVLKAQGGAVVLDSADLGGEMTKGITGLKSLFTYLTGLDTAGKGSIAPEQARWVVQSGTEALTYAANADSKVDVIMGYTGDDVMDAGAGNDILIGGAGADKLTGGVGLDHLYGGADNDTLDGGVGGDYLYGGAGSDTYNLKSGELFDTIQDSDGNGKIFIDGVQLTGGNKVSDNYWTKDGSEWGYLLTTGGDLVISKGSSLDRIVVKDWQSTTGDKLGINLDAAATTPPPAPGVFSYPGHADGDWFSYAYWGNETSFSIDGGITFYDRLDFSGLGGNDMIFGLPLDDKLDGGDGDDVIFGGLGSDQIQGGAGKDVIVSNVNADKAYIASWDISVPPGYFPLAVDWTSGTSWDYSHSSDAHLYGIPENWLIKRDAGGSLLIVDFVATRINISDDLSSVTARDAEDPSQGDIVNAGADDDLVWGGLGADTLLGGTGVDQLQGLGGADVMEGGDGADAIYGDINHFPLLMNLGHIDAGRSLMDIHPYQKDIDPAVQGSDVIDGGAGDDSLTSDDVLAVPEGRLLTIWGILHTNSGLAAHALEVGYTLFDKGDSMSTQTSHQDSFTQLCRRTRRASVPARLCARGPGACETQLRWRQRFGWRSPSVATANWLRRSGTATRHVCGLGGSGDEQHQNQQVRSMRLPGSKMLPRRMNAVLLARLGAPA